MRERDCGIHKNIRLSLEKLRIRVLRVDDERRDVKPNIHIFQFKHQLQLDDDEFFLHEEFY